MDLRQLRYFATLADTLNFHRAAERLNMSQPPLTVAIRKLEEEFGAALFVREARGVRLTAAGLAALPHARAALVEAELAREAVRQGAEGVRGRLVVGCIGSAVNELLPRIVSPFREAYPDVELVLEEMTSAEIAHAIRARRIDVGLVRLPLIDAADMIVAVVERDELVVAAHESKGLPEGEVDLATLADEPFIIFSPVSVLNAAIRLACQRAGFAPRVAQNAVQVQTIVSLVQAGLGVALVPSRAARSIPASVRLLPLAQPVTIEMGIAYPDGANSLARNFVRRACEVTDMQAVSE